MINFLLRSYRFIIGLVLNNIFHYRARRKKLKFNIYETVKRRILGTIFHEMFPLPRTIAKLSMVLETSAIVKNGQKRNQRFEIPFQLSGSPSRVPFLVYSLFFSLYSGSTSVMNRSFSILILAPSQDVRLRGQNTLIKLQGQLAEEIRPVSWIVARSWNNQCVQVRDNSREFNSRSRCTFFSFRKIYSTPWNRFRVSFGVSTRRCYNLRGI